MNTPTFDVPFLVQHLRQNEAAGHFTPAAYLAITPALRTSGLLAALSPTDAKALLTVLTFLTPNGNLRPSTHELAAALGCSLEALQDHLEPLTRLRVEQEPIVQLLPNRAGYTLGATVLKHLQAKELVPTAEPLPYPVARREVIIAASRAKYARPRAEVEREIEQGLGHHESEAEDSLEGEARRQLYALGVPREEIASLLIEHSPEEVLQQLEWLPERGAKSPARFVVAAIRGGYAAPGAPRVQRATVGALSSLWNRPQGYHPGWDGSQDSDESQDSEVLSLPVPPLVQDTLPEQDTLPQGNEEAPFPEYNTIAEQETVIEHNPRTDSDVS